MCSTFARYRLWMPKRSVMIHNKHVTSVRVQTPKIHKYKMLRQTFEYMGQMRWVPWGCDWLPLLSLRHAAC